MVTGTRPVRVEEVGRRGVLGRGDHLLPRQEGRGRDEGTLETLSYAVQGFKWAASADRFDIFTKERVQSPAES